MIAGIIGSVQDYLPVITNTQFKIKFVSTTYGLYPVKKSYATIDRIPSSFNKEVPSLL